MKKIIAMLLVLVMSVTGLVGCGSSNKSGSEAGSTSTSSDYYIICTDELL